MRTLNGRANSYPIAETAGAAQTLQQDVLALVNAPALALLGRPLIGNGANGEPGTGANSAAGGILYGTGGAGAPGGNGGAAGTLFGADGLSGLT